METSERLERERTSDFREVALVGSMTANPLGGSVLCEEGSRAPQDLHPLSRDGHFGELARDDMRFRGQKNGFKGDFRGTEWAGATFSLHGTCLFAITSIKFAITGPWDELGL